MAETVFKHLLRDPKSVNAMKQTCDMNKHNSYIFNYRGHTHFLCINIYQVLRKLFELEAIKGRVFKHLLRDPKSDNAMKQTCILADFTLFPPKLHWEHC